MSAALFKKKCLVPSKRVCLRLKAAREQALVTLDQLAKRTKINRRYLEALEECRFQELKHSPLYQKNFIKKYVEALGLDPEPFLKQFKEEELKYKQENNQHPGVGCSKKQLSNLPSLVRFLIIAGLLCMLFFYLGNHVFNILKAPELVISTPEDGEITTENVFIIQGKTEGETKVMINDEAIANDEKGNFSQAITLTPGINTIVIVAENKHGKTTQETRHIIYKGST